MPQEKYERNPENIPYYELEKSIDESIERTDTSNSLTNMAKLFTQATTASINHRTKEHKETYLRRKN
jgi:hypothetical protein